MYINIHVEYISPADPPHRRKKTPCSQQQCAPWCWCCCREPPGAVKHLLTTWRSHSPGEPTLSKLGKGTIKVYFIWRLLNLRQWWHVKTWVQDDVFVCCLLPSTWVVQISIQNFLKSNAVLATLGLLSQLSDLFGLLGRDHEGLLPWWKISKVGCRSAVIPSVSQGSSYYQPKQCTMKGKSLNITIDLHCLIPPQKKREISWSLSLALVSLKSYQKKISVTKSHSPPKLLPH